MAIFQSYHIAQSIQDALLALNHAPVPARIVAGGTDLLLDLQQGRHLPVHTLVDVTRVPEMTCLELRGNSLFIGASVPLSQVALSPLVLQHAHALAESAGLIGGPQVRNTGTLGGNVAHALPAADGAIALLALDARAEVVSLDGARLVGLADLYTGPGVTALAPLELITGFYLPLVSVGEASAFRRVMRPQGVALPVLNGSVWLRREGDRIAGIRIAIGPAGPVPRRARQAEDCLYGQILTGERLEYAWQNLVSNARFRSSPHRASSTYRRSLSSVLLEETLWVAWERALVSGNAADRPENN